MLVCWKLWKSVGGRKSMFNNAGTWFHKILQKTCSYCFLMLLHFQLAVGRVKTRPEKTGLGGQADWLTGWPCSTRPFHLDQLPQLKTEFIFQKPKSGFTTVTFPARKPEYVQTYPAEGILFSFKSSKSH